MAIGLLAAMAAMLSLMSALIYVGSRAWRNARRAPGPQDAFSWPRVALIVPVAGAAPGLAQNLATLLNQDYPDYRVVFVTRDPQDPATPVIAGLIQSCQRARLVHAGPSHTCGQKNHNLLAGIRVSDPEAAVLAFCDANQQAPPDWLRELVLPLAAGEAEVTSGYHHAMPVNGGVPAWGRAIFVLTLLLTKGIRRLDQPWGGATAITRRLFEELGVAQVWSETVVDDVTLAVLLQGAKITPALSAGAVSLTPLVQETWPGWTDWLTRQWVYLRFCLPGAWLVGGLVQLAFTGLMALVYVLIPLALAGVVSPVYFLAGGQFILLLSLVGLALRQRHPQPPSASQWLKAFFAVIFMGAWCHARTWFAREIRWRGITYRVGQGGKVLEIIQP